MAMNAKKDGEPKPLMCRKHPQIVIHHPTGVSVTPTFCVFGWASGDVKEVSGFITSPLTIDSKELVEKKKLPLEIFKVGTTVLHPPFWAIQFEKLPLDTNLQLWVLGTLEKGAPPLLAMPFKTMTKDRDTVISWPPSETNNVPTTFTAYGTGGKTGDAVTGFLEGPAGYVATGGGAPNWYVKFVGVEPGYPYSLTVRVGSQTPASSEQLTIV